MPLAPRSARSLPVLIIVGVCGLPLAACQPDEADRAASRESAGGPPATASGKGGDALDRLRADTRALIATARDRVFPALVNIDVVSLEYQGGKEAKSRSTGSGTIISPDGYVLTNAHVTDQGYRFWCVLADKQRVPAKLVGEDPWTDLAVLKIDTSRLADPKRALPYAEFGDSDELKVGDYVLAMGSPFSLSRTVTLGIVSNTERVFTSTRDAGEVDEMMLNWEQRTGLFTTWIQHDALINPGNSGGPLVTLAGRIIGINTRGGAGMAFATPSNMARAVAESLMAKGEVLRSAVGASFRHTQNTGIERGVLVDSVEVGGPAEEAGLKSGDIVTAIDGKPVSIRYAEEVPPLLKTLADRPIGSTVTFDFIREGKPESVALKTEKLMKDRGDEAALRTWGLTAQRITERAAQLRKLKSTKGALVSSIRSGGPAEQAEPKIGWGDVVRRVDDTPVESLQDLVDKYKAISELKDKPEHVLVEFERDGKSYVSLLKPTPPEQQDPAPDVARAWVGVATQPVIRTMAEKLAATWPGSAAKPDARGFRVVRVYSGTEAARAGLKAGDIITAIDDDKVQPKGLAEAGLFNREIRRLSIGDTVTLGVLRDGEELKLPVKLETTRAEPHEVPKTRDTDFEIAVREITFFDRQDESWDESVQGVVVASAEPAGWAGLAGIRTGDLIQKIGDDTIASPEDFKKALDRVKREQPTRVVFVVYRGVRTYFRFVEPDWKPTEKNADGTAKNTTQD